MDFKALMAAQISKAKPAANGKPAESSTKYQRRSEQEARRIADYEAERETLERERKQREARKRKLEAEEAEENLLREEKKRKFAAESQRRREAEEAEQERLRRKRLGLPEISQEAEDESQKEPTSLAEDQPDIPDDELRLRLREVNQPAVLYDESHTGRLKRYYQVTSTGQSSSSLSESSTTANKKKNQKTRYTNGPIQTTLEPVEEKDMLLPSKTTSNTIPAKDSEEYNFILRQLASYLSLLLTEWSRALSSRPEAIKTSQDGQRAYQTYLTVLQDLTPLFRRMESHDLPNDLLSPIIEICHHCQNRRYVTANDTYLQLSIGKAAWPIGVTMVGIHERSAREKLHNADSTKQAHIMADEQTRKMLQSLKRCLSFAQTRWTPDDIGQLMG